jgi:hypothetical protein
MLHGDFLFFNEFVGGAAIVNGFGWASNVSKERKKAKR